LTAKGEVKGVLEIFNRSPLNVDMDWLDFLDSLSWQTAIAIDNALLFEKIQRSNFDLEMAYNATIEGWSHALDLRDKETEGTHPARYRSDHKTCPPDGHLGQPDRACAAGFVAA
jgi:hypothetical protein